MIVSVSVPDNKSYQLTSSRLEKMWDKYAEDELRGTGLKVKQNIVLTKGKRGDQFIIQISSIFACKYTNTAVDI